jgi:hypothetical protein
MTTPPEHFRRTTLIRQARGLSATTKLVLFVVETYADRHTGLAWPSVETIADDCGLSYEATRKALRSAIEAGLLERVVTGRPFNAPPKVNVYRVLPPGHPTVTGKPERSAKAKKQRGRQGEGAPVGGEDEAADVVTKRPLDVVTKRPPNCPLNYPPVAWQAATPDESDPSPTLHDPDSGGLLH